MVAKQKILIVDDDNNIAELISLYLTKECFETKIVNDGELALKEFQTFRPNLILLDLMLPGIDAIRSAVRSATPQTCRSLCFPQKEKPLTRYLAWSLAPTTTLSSLLIQKNWLPVSVQFYAVSSPNRLQL